MQDGIWYIKDKYIFALIEGDNVSMEEREHFTHVEFWWDGQLLETVPIGRCTHEFLLNLSKNANWPQIIKCGLLS